ncbi:MAG: hypothetical protein LUC33_04495 [Prevotellaceae bacterium]|nr:hypothetical protein [Prevotellaceae bacterium]
MEEDTGRETAATFDGGIGEDQIRKWKQVHGKVIRIDVADGDELHVGYFKRPSLETMSAVSKVAKTDEVKASAVMFDNCWLGGSERMRTDAVLFMATAGQLGSALNGCTASLKNL